MPIRARPCLAPPSMRNEQGPEIRTGKLKDGKAVQLVAGQEVTVTTDYEADGDSTLIAMRCAAGCHGGAGEARGEEKGEGGLSGA